MYNHARSNSAYVGMAQIVHWNVLAETINVLLKTDQFLKNSFSITFCDNPFIMT